MIELTIKGIFYIGIFWFMATSFWLWILDAWGWIEMKEYWEVFVPQSDGQYNFTDYWVEVNTYRIAFNIKVIEKELGIKFDYNNADHMTKLNEYAWPYLGEQLHLVNIFAIFFWWT